MLPKKQPILTVSQSKGRKLRYLSFIHLDQRYLSSK